MFISRSIKKCRNIVKRYKNTICTHNKACDGVSKTDLNTVNCPFWKTGCLLCVFLSEFCSG